MLLKIIPYPSPILRKKSKAVKTVDKKIRKLIDDMIETMHAAPGIGLAAPQVGENIKVITIDIGQGAFGIINPKVTKKNKLLVPYEEGCLSLVGIVGTVCRPSEIVVEGMDRNGKKLIIEATGVLAVVLQHEIDHLDGIMLIDRVQDRSTIREVSKKSEEEKQELI